MNTPILSKSPQRNRGINFSNQIMHSPPDVFVGTGFRYWLTGLRTGDLAHWEQAFILAQTTLGLEAARHVCRDFSQWVRLLSENSRRDLHVLAPESRCFCRDECIATAVVAAHQHKACPALQACALALLGCDRGEELIALTGALADRLSAADQLVSHTAMDHVVRYAGKPAHKILQ